MDKERKLLDIAEEQQGYFTSRQAVDCGFSRSNFHRKLLSGKWSKESRGIYKLTHFPISSRPELVFWTLWSADKQGNPQGIWSHETALDIHGLSDVSPKKLHMSVPLNFRKNTPIPNCIHLHFREKMPQTDIEVRQGYRVTTPLKTLADVIQENVTQHEQIERVILGLALQKSLIQGFTTIQELEKLHTESQEMREIIWKSIDSVWMQANTQLADFGRIVEPYTIGLSFQDHPSEPTFGTAVLCLYKSQYFFLTATHVARALLKKKFVKLLLRFDNALRDYPSHPSKNFTVVEWDPSFKDNMLNDVLENHPKDLSIVIPTQEIINTLKLYKDFYVIPENIPLFSLQDALISLGGIEPIYSNNGSNCQLNVGPYAFVASNYDQLPDVDYITCPVSNHTYEIRNFRRKAISTFAGLSGSGLWKFTNNNPVLVGIAIAQTDYYPSSGLRNVYFHGFHSILLALLKFKKTHGHKL